MEKDEETDDWEEAHVPRTALVRRRHVDLLRTASARCPRTVGTPRR